MTDFWPGGPQAYERGLREEYAQKRLELEEQRQSAETEEQRSQIAARLRELEDELRRKLNRSGGSLF